MTSHKDPTKNASKSAAVESLSAWERWQLPNMDSDCPVKSNAYNITTRPAPRVADLVGDEDEEIKPLTAEDLEAIREAAYKEGFQQGVEEGKKQGYEQGYNQGMAEGESDVKAMVTKLSQICRTLLEPIPKQDDELEQALLQMVEQICRRIVHRELKLDSEATVTIVREAIDCLNPGSERLRIHLNQQDTEFVLEQLKQIGEWDDSWRIIAHPTITPGGCIIETDASLVDARAERRLATVIEQVYQQQHQALEDGNRQHGNVDQLMDELSPFVDDASDHEACAEDIPEEIESSHSELVDIEEDIEPNESKPAS